MTGDHSGAAVPTATLRIHRVAEGRAGLRGFQVVVDGEPVGRLAEGATETFSMTPGVHRLWVHLDRSGTPDHEVVLEPGQTADLRVRFAGSAWNPLRDTRHDLMALEPVPGSSARIREVAPPATARRSVRLGAVSRLVLVLAVAALAAVLAHAAGARLG